MLYEDDVVAAVAAHLEDAGDRSRIRPRSASEAGVDIVAERMTVPGWRLHIEANGVAVVPDCGGATSLRRRSVADLRGWE